MDFYLQTMSFSPYRLLDAAAVIAYAYNMTLSVALHYRFIFSIESFKLFVILCHKQLNGPIVSSLNTNWAVWMWTTHGTARAVDRRHPDRSPLAVRQATVVVMIVYARRSTTARGPSPPTTTSGDRRHHYRGYDLPKGDKSPQRDGAFKNKDDAVDDKNKKPSYSYNAVIMMAKAAGALLQTTMSRHDYLQQQQQTARKREK